MTTAELRQRVNSIVSVWKSLITPSPAIREPHRQRQARLLAIFHVLIVPLGLFVSLFNLLPSSSLTLFDETALPLFAVLTVVLVFTYFLSRTSRYEWGAAIALGSINIFMFSTVILGATTIGFNLLYCLVVLLMVFNLFFSLRSTLLFTGVNVVLLMLLPRIAGRVTPPETVLGPTICLIVGMSIVWLMNHQRELLEKERYEELAASQEQMRVITDNLNDIVSRLDANGVIRYMSPSLERVLGYSPEEAIGQSYKDWLARIHPDDVERVAQTTKEMLGNGKVTLNPYRIRHADGHYVWMEPVITPLHAPDGSPDGVILLTRDITKRKEAEEALQASEAKFRALSDTIDVGILISQGTKLVFANPAALRWFDYSFEELQSLDLLSLAHPDSKAFLLDRLRARQTGETSQARYEIKFLHKSGETRWVLMSTMMSEYEGVPSIITTFFDITESKRAEEQRLELALEREKVRLLQQLIGDLSHDLRNPLAIMGTSLYLLNKATTPEKRQHHTDVMTAQMTHLEKVLEDLASITELEKDMNGFVLKPVDVNQLIEDVKREYLPTAAGKKQTFNCTLAPGTPQVMAEQQQLSRALSNIINNALSYTPDGGEISIQAETREQRLEIRVRDNGIGIRADDLPHIFDHFFRGDKARNTETGGTGLGLTIAQRIILAHGGKIEVESEVGVGTVVSISLPLVGGEV